jgi:hypothetical protein
VLQTGISDNSWDTPEAKTSEKANLQPEEKLTLIFSALIFQRLLCKIEYGELKICSFW